MLNIIKHSYKAATRPNLNNDNNMQDKGLPQRHTTSAKEDKIMEEYHNIDSTRQQYLTDIENLNKLMELYNTDKASFEESLEQQLNLSKSERMNLYKKEEELFTDLESFSKLVKLRKDYLSKPIGVPEKLYKTLEDKTGDLIAKLLNIKIERNKCFESSNEIKNKIMKTDSLIADLAKNLFAPKAMSNTNYSKGSSMNFDDENLNNRSSESIKHIYLRQAEKQHKHLSKNMYSKDAATDNLVDQINRVEHVRSKIQVHAGNNPDLLNSLGNALKAIRKDYMRQKNKMKQGNDEFGDSIDNQSNSMSQSGLHKKQRRMSRDFSDASDEEYIDKQQEAIIDQINIEKNLQMIERLNHLKQDKRRYEGSLIDMTNTVSRQNEVTKGYQELQYQKSLFKKEIASERAGLMRDREFMSEELNELKNIREEFEIDKRRMYLEDRKSDLKKNRTDMMDLVNTFLYHQANTYVKKPNELVKDGLMGNADHGVHGLTTQQAAMKVQDSDVMKVEVKNKFEEQIRDLQAKEMRNRQIAEQIAMRQGIHIDPATAQYTHNLGGPKIVLTQPNEDDKMSEVRSRRY